MTILNTLNPGVKNLIVFVLLSSLLLSNFGVAFVARAEDAPQDPPPTQSAPEPGPEPEPEPTPPSCTDDEELVDGECVPKAPPPPPDACPNLDGQQDSVPGGYHLDGDNCVEDTVLPADSTSNTNNNASSTPGQDGSQGQNGTSTNQTPPSDGNEAVIGTGNATSSATAVSGANLTDVDTNASSTATSTPGTASSTPTCLVCADGGGSTTVNIGSDLTGSTTASSTSNTGDNAAVDPDGVLIDTGAGVASVIDIFAYAVALVNSTGEILLLKNPLSEELDLRERILNVFEGLTGEEGSCTLTACQTADAMFNYGGDSTSDVERTTYAGCNAGGNEGTASSGLVLIDTGDCLSSNLTVTIGHLTAINSRYLIILMNHLGDMQGNILLPEAGFFEELRGGAALGGGSDLFASSTVEIETNATSTAEAGGNTAVGETLSEVESGGADSHAFTGNFANQINPPICFIISVGGEWSGDVYQIPGGFDREHTPYADIICGRGGGESGPAATDLHATTTNYAKLLVNAIAEATTGNNTAEGAAAIIKSGDAESFLFVLNILNTLLISQDWVFGLFTVSGDWDGDFYFGAPPAPTPAEQAASQILSGPVKKKKKESAPSADVSLTKVASVSTTTYPAVVDYTITLKNNGNKLYQALLEDVMTDPDGEMLNQESWDLGVVLAGEEITVSYSMEFGGDLLPGDYTNAVRLTGRKGGEGGTKVQPVYTSATITLLGEVLGLGECPAYLTKYISPGGLNDPEQVRLLETFLRDGRGEAIEPDGVYDTVSLDAVKRFQAEYSNDVLGPWGIDFTTGHVYYTTQKKINELYCQGQKEFALSQGQLAEIAYYKEFVLGQGPLAPEHLGGPTDGPSLSEMFNLGDDRIVESAPYFYPSRRGEMLTILETFFSWMRYLATVPEASARGI